MKITPARRLRAGLAIPAAFVLVAFLTFLGLGTWQIQRKAWKEALIYTLQQRLSAPPTDLPPREWWARLDPTADEFRHVKFSATFLSESEALVYAGGSALRSDVSGPGYWVLAPARLADGGVVVVNRGFVPEGRQEPVTRSADQITGIVAMVGVMRWPQPRGAFSPNDEPGRNLWFVRDPVGDRIHKGLGRGCAVLCRIGKSAAAQRPSARRHPQRELAQRTSAVRDHMVRARRGGRGDVRVLASQP